MVGRKRSELTGTGIVTEFARRLRTLRDESGLTLRQLAAKSGYSHSALSLAESGRVVPSWDVISAFVQACGQEPAQWRQVWEIAHAAASAPAAPDELPLPDVLADEAEAGQHRPVRHARRRIAVLGAAVGLVILGAAASAFLLASIGHNHVKLAGIAQMRHTVLAKDGTDPYADGCKADEKQLDWQPVMGANHVTFGTILLMYSPACQAAWGYLDGPNRSTWTTHIIAHRIPGNTTAPSEFNGNAAYGSWGNVLSTRAGCVYIEAYVVDRAGRGPSAKTACIQPSLAAAP